MWYGRFLGAVTALLMRLASWIVFFRFAWAGASLCFGCMVFGAGAEFFSKMFNRDKPAETSLDGQGHQMELGASAKPDTAGREEENPVSNSERLFGLARGQSEEETLRDENKKLTALVSDLQARVYEPATDPAHDDSCLIRTAAVMEYIGQTVFACYLATYYDELNQLSLKYEL